MRKRKKRYPKTRLLSIHNEVNNNHKRKGLPPKRKHRKMIGRKNRPKKPGV